MYLKHLEWFQYLRSSDSYAEFDIKYHPSLNLSMCTGLRRDTGADVVVKVFDRDDGTAIGPGDRDVLARCCPGLRGCHVPSQPNSHFPQRSADSASPLFRLLRGSGRAMWCRWGQCGVR